MSIGKKIKQLRELRNYTQSFMANELGLSLGGYGKIERDETELTVNRLEQIARILETNLSSILNFDSSQIFNQYNNRTANANVQNQQIIGDEALSQIFMKMTEEIKELRSEVAEMKNKNS